MTGGVTGGSTDEELLSKDPHDAVMGRASAVTDRPLLAEQGVIISTANMVPNPNPNPNRNWKASSYPLRIWLLQIQRDVTLATMTRLSSGRFTPGSQTRRRNTF